MKPPCVRPTVDIQRLADAACAEPDDTQPVAQPVAAVVLGQWLAGLAAWFRRLAGMVTTLRRRGACAIAVGLLRAARRFAIDTFLRGPLAFFRLPCDRRECAFMIAGALPLSLATAVMLLPGMVFNHPDHRAYYYFGRMIESDAVSVLPLLIGILSLLAMLRIPLQHPGAGETTAPSRFERA